MSSDVQITYGSDNVFADLGLPEANAALAKTDLAIELARAIRESGMTQLQAAKTINLPQPKVSAILRGDTRNVSAEKLMDSLTRLKRNVRITVSPAAPTQTRGWVSVGKDALPMAASKSKPGGGDAVRFD